MKFKINIRKMSFNFLGTILLICSVIILCMSFYKLNITAIVTAFVFVALSYLIKIQSKHIIFRGKRIVIEKISNTLNLLKLEVKRDANKFTVKKTMTKIAVYNVFGLAILSFKFSERNSEKENFLATTLVKLQMQD